MILKLRLFKTDSRDYGHLPARQVRGMPWQQVDVDLIGLWSVTTGTGKTYVFHALTCIDHIINLPELICINDKSSEEVAAKFKECWLSRYPRPEMCAHDGGGEFIGPKFQALLYSFEIHDIGANACNPQGNSICEQMHKDVGNTLTCLVHTDKPRTLDDAKNYVNSALATCMYTLRANVSRVTGNSPGALAFHRNMIMNIPLQADLCVIRARRQLQVDNNLMRANARQYDCDYQPGQKVLKKRHTLN